MSSTGSPSGSAAASERRAAGCRAGARPGAGHSSARSCLRPAGRRAGRTRRPARRVVPGPRQLEQRERVAVALGDDPVADRGVQRAVHVVEQQRPRIAPPRPWSHSSGSPARTRRRSPVRAAHTIAIRSARRRRATNPRTWAEARSSHCASSTRQTAAAPRRPRPAGSAWPGRPGTGPGPARALSPNTVASASRCGTGEADRGGPASGRRAGGGRCRRVPSPTRRPTARATCQPATRSAR